MTLFLVLVVVWLGIAFFVGKLSRFAPDHFFQPMPGFVFIAGLFFLAGIAVSPIEIQPKTLTILVTGLLFMSIGTLIVSRFGYKEYDRVDIKEVFSKTFPKKYVFGMALFGLSVTFLLWAKSGIPLFAVDVDAAREAFVSNGYIATLATTLDVSAVACYAYALTFKGKKKTVSYYLALGVIGAFIVVAVLSGARTRLAKFIVPAIIVRHFLHKPIKVSRIIILGVIGFLFVGGLGFYRAYSRWGYDVYQGLGVAPNEVTLIGLISHYALFEVYVSINGLQQVVSSIPALSDYMYGLLHVGPFVSPLQIDIPVPGEYFKQVVGGTWSGFGLAATIFAPMYADLGMGGVAFFSTLYGVVLGASYQSIFNASSRAPYSLIIYAFLYFFYATGLRSNVVSFETLWFIIVAWSIGYFRRA